MDPVGHGESRLGLAGNGFSCWSGWLTGWLGWFGDLIFVQLFPRQKMDEMMRKCWKSKLKSFLESTDLY